MTASCLSTPLPAPLLQRPQRHPQRLPRWHRLQRRLPRLRLAPGVRELVLVLVLLMAAVLLAPEQPLAQADICERHNGAAACRVW